MLRLQARDSEPYVEIESMAAFLAKAQVRMQLSCVCRWCVRESADGTAWCVCLGGRDALTHCIHPLQHALHASGPGGKSLNIKHESKTRVHTRSLAGSAETDAHAISNVCLSLSLSLSLCVSIRIARRRGRTLWVGREVAVTVA